MAKKKVPSTFSMVGICRKVTEKSESQDLISCFTKVTPIFLTELTLNIKAVELNLELLIKTNNLC